MSNTIKTDYGYDLFWAKTPSYASKILVFEEEGGKLPLHFYPNLERTWFINSGEFVIRWINTVTGEVLEGELKEGMVFHIDPLTPVNVISRSAGSSITEVNNGIDEQKSILSNT